MLFKNHSEVIVTVLPPLQTFPQYTNHRTAFSPGHFCAHVLGLRVILCSELLNFTFVDAGFFFFFNYENAKAVSKMDPSNDL